MKKNQAKLRSAGQKAASQPRLDVGPVAPARRYAGTYRDVWYGDVAIAQEGGKLVIRFMQTPELVGDLVHWQHDTLHRRAGATASFGRTRTRPSP